MRMSYRYTVSNIDDELLYYRKVRAVKFQAGKKNTTTTRKKKKKER
jgi:hypothetical protein